MKERFAIALGTAANILGWVLIELVLLFWAFEIGRAVGRGVIP